MSIDSEKKEIGEVVNRLLDNLSLAICSRTCELGGSLRRQIGLIRAKYLFWIEDGIFPMELQKCFDAVITANGTLASLTAVRQGLFAEKPQGDISTLIVMLAVTFCLATESKILTKEVFVCRDDVEKVMKRMKCAFDTARELAADAINSAVYQSLTFLAGALTNHLAVTARPLPRMVKFTLPKNFPALTLSHRLYQDASRVEELIAENRIVHPAFCPREIWGLSK